MNIKEHIEAGHYPTDLKGRALVPMSEGRGIPATILATDVGDSWTIVGFCLGQVYRWNHNGADRGTDCPIIGHLLPPAPRKVKVTRWAVMMLPVADNISYGSCSSRELAEVALSQAVRPAVIVELTGDVEEPWS